MSRLIRVERLNRRWARVSIPGCGRVRFRLMKGRDLPEAKSIRVTYRNGEWHAGFAMVPHPKPAPGTGEVIGVDRGVTITAALSNGRKLNCPQLSDAERTRHRKHQRRASRAPKNSDLRAAEFAKAAKIKAKEVARRKDWVEKTSTMLATGFDVIRFEKLNIKNMTASARGTSVEPGRNVAAKAGLNRAILAQGWGQLRARTQQKAPGRVEDIPAPFTSLRCSTCGWIEKDSRKSQAEFSCVSCGFTCNADINAAINVAAGHAGETTPHHRASVREPQPAMVEIPSLWTRGCQTDTLVPRCGRRYPRARLLRGVSGEPRRIGRNPSARSGVLLYEEDSRRMRPGPPEGRRGQDTALARASHR